MQFFEAIGLWYPVDDRNKSVSGMLKYDQDGLQLSLFGSFNQGWGEVGERYPLIHGVVGNSPYGSFVTLIDCFRNSTNFTSIGLTSEKISCHKAAIGNFHIPDGTVHFESLELDFSYLVDWVGKGGMNVERKLRTENTYLASYKRPQKIDLAFEDKTAMLWYNFNSKESAHTTTMTESVSLLIKPLGDRGPEALGNDYVRTFQDFISFATDRPNATEMIAYRAASNEPVKPKVNIVYDPIFRLGKKKEIVPHDILFSYADASEAGINVIQSWADFSKKYVEFCEVYFSSLYAPPKYLEQKFEFTMTAFTLLAKNLSETSERTTGFLADAHEALGSRFTTAELEFVSHLLPTDSEVEMPFRLLHLLSANSNLMGQLIEDFPTFVRSISDTLYHIRRRVDGHRPPLTGSELFYAKEKIETLIKVVILKELGFGIKIEDIMNKNRYFEYLKSL